MFDARTSRLLFDCGSIMLTYYIGKALYSGLSAAALSTISIMCDSALEIVTGSFHSVLELYLLMMMVSRVFKQS